jgi:hypothetical protein
MIHEYLHIRKIFGLITIICISLGTHSTAFDFNSIALDNQIVGDTQFEKASCIHFLDSWSLEGEFSIGYAVQYDKYP